MVSYHPKWGPQLLEMTTKEPWHLLKIQHSKAKHIDIRYHFVRECYNDGKISLDYVPSGDNIADIFTKPPKKHLLQKFEQFLFGQK